MHEAGHAVMALALRGELTRVSIVPDQQTLGHAVFKARTDTTDSLIVLGGVAAEQIVLGKIVGGYGENGDGDLDWIDRNCTPKTAKALLNVAQHLIKLHMPALWALSSALLQRRVLSGADVKKVLAGKMAPKVT